MLKSIYSLSVNLVGWGLDNINYSEIKSKPLWGLTALKCRRSHTCGVEASRMRYCIHAEPFISNVSHFSLSLIFSSRKTQNKPFPWHICQTWTKHMIVYVCFPHVYDCTMFVLWLYSLFWYYIQTIFVDNIFIYNYNLYMLL